ncbi:MAG: polysaccharide biosynthesis tyrosine autokinase [Kiritimatiellales bacterium]|nr:polysaccharide biosynthesis tyrosine autokinase [Kiritimatiellales bacterium]
MSDEVKQQQQQEKTLHFLDYWRVIRSRKEIVLAVAFLVVLTGTAYTLMLPNLYAATVRISVSEDNPDIDPFGGTSYGMTYNPYFLRTQFEIIQSKPILYEVINRLNLQEEWGKQGEKIQRDVAYSILRGSISVNQHPDTTLIAISTRRNNPNEAAKIANELAEVYRDSRLDLRREETRFAIDKIKEELQKQRERVDAAETELERLRKDLDISIIGGDAGGFNIDSMKLQQLEGDRIAAQREMMEKQGLLDILAQLEDKDLIEQASYITYDQNVVSTRLQILDTEVQLKSLLEEYGENHPEVKSVMAAKQRLEVNLQQFLISLRNGLQTDFAMAKNTYDSLQKLLAEYRTEDIGYQGEKYRPFKNAQEELDSERYVYNQVKAKMRQEIITLEVPRHPVEIIDIAEPNARPVSPNLFMNVLMSIFVGLGAGVGLAYFIEYLDTSIKTADDVERLLSLPVLGLIPQKVRPLVEEGPDSDHAEAYRVLRTNLAFTEGGSSKGAFCVLSGGAGEGKSTTVFNLAYVCAQQGEKVLLIDADLRRPVQHTILGLSNRFGLTNVLLRDVPVEEAIKATSVPNLHFLPSGRLPRTSLGVLDPKRIGELIASLKSKYDVVLIDTPPLVGISDSSIIAKETDGAILVIQYRKYPRDMIIKAKQMLESLGVPAIGVVLNNINIMRDDYYYYYHSYYSDYSYYRSGESMPDEGVDT